MYIKRLIWDDWNIKHIARHNVKTGQVEQVCHGNYITQSTYGGRILVIGPTKAGRVLATILAPKGKDTYYPVTARPADRKERRMYQQQKGGVIV
jgi:uncharacterized DUF497 family protein